MKRREEELNQNYLKSRISYYNNKELRDKKKRQEKINRERLWVSENHRCEHCGKIMTEKFGSGRFCSRACANSHKKSEESKNKTATTLSQYYKNNSEAALNRNRKYSEAVQKYNKIPNYCCVCGKPFLYEQRNRQSCSLACKKVLLSKAGKKAAQTNKEIKRSKNEIYFYNLCLDQFKNVKHNEAIFNGWDADIIIEDYKIAVLWNGPWHYKQIMKNQNCSLKQIQNRDKLKLKEIEKFGYTPYIVEDPGRYCKSFVKDQFQTFLKNLLS